MKVPNLKVTDRIEGDREATAALHGLLSIEGVHGTNWIPDAELKEAIQESANCTPQAAFGALRALQNVGLATRSETHEGVFWKAPR